MLPSSLDLIAFGGACKALEQGWIGGYLVLFGTRAQHDLSSRRDYFTPTTDYDLPGCNYKSRTLYDHGLDPTIGKRRLAVGALGADDVGVWIKAQLHVRDEYEAGIYQLARLKKLGWSSGTASHLVERKAIEHEGELVHEVLAWPLGLDASITPRPADPRGVVEVKSLALDVVPMLEEWLADPAIKASVDAIRESAGAGRTFYSFGNHGEDRKPRQPAHTMGSNTPGSANINHDASDIEVKGVSRVRSLAWLDRVLAQTFTPVLVDFWAYGMHPGEQAAWGAARYGSTGSPTSRRDLLEDIAEHYGERLKVARVDLARSAELGSRYNVFDSATLLLRDGRVIARTDGAHALETMIANIDHLLGRTVETMATSEGEEARDEPSDVKSEPIEQVGAGVRTGYAACAEIVTPPGMPAYTWPDWVLAKRGEDRTRDVGFIGDQAQLAGRNPYDRRDLLPDGWGDLCLSFAVPRLDMLRKSGAESASYYGLDYDTFLTTVRALFLCARASALRGQREEREPETAVKCACCGGDMLLAGDEDEEGSEAMKLTAEQLLKLGAQGGAGGAPIRVYCPQCPPGGIRDGVIWGSARGSGDGAVTPVVSALGLYDCSAIWNPAWGAQPTFTNEALAVAGSSVANPYHASDLLPEQWQSFAHAGVRPSLDELARRVWQLSYDQLESVVKNLYLCLRARRLTALDQNVRENGLRQERRAAAKSTAQVSATRDSTTRDSTTREDRQPSLPEPLPTKVLGSPFPRFRWPADVLARTGDADDEHGGANPYCADDLLPDAWDEDALYYGAPEYPRGIASGDRWFKDQYGITRAEYEERRREAYLQARARLACATSGADPSRGADRERATKSGCRCGDHDDSGDGLKRLPERVQALNERLARVLPRGNV